MKTLLIVAAINWLTIPVAGALASLLTLSKPYNWRFPLVMVRASNLFMRIAETFTRFPIRACTWGPWCWSFRWDVGDTPDDLRLVRHEQTHAWWALLVGLLFFVMYGVASLVAVVRGKNWYQDNAFEVAARKAEDP